jgi:hypothetical protein
LNLESRWRAAPKFASEFSLSRNAAPFLAAKFFASPMESCHVASQNAPSRNVRPFYQPQSSISSLARSLKVAKFGQSPGAARILVAKSCHALREGGF